MPQATKMTVFPGFFIALQTQALADNKSLTKTLSNNVASATNTVV